MKRFSLFLILSTTVFQLFAQSTTDVESSSVVINFTAIILFVVIAAHMVYKTFFGDNFRTDYTAEEFDAARKEEGLPSLTKEDIRALDAQLDEIDTIWGEIVDTAGDTVCYPHKHSAVKQSIAIVAKVVDAKPANKSLVEKINTINELLNHSLSRQFNGSKAIIAIAVILGVVLGICTDALIVVATFVFTIALYILASRTPNFMLIAQLAEGREVPKSLLSRVIRSLFMGVATAKTYKREKINSDGTKTTKVDRSEKWISLLIAVVVSLLLAAILPLVAVVNYVRNYLIYR
jgi:hypothetical protein